MMTEVEAQTTCVAPGKLILSGEHAVVYGAPALAVPIDQSLHVKLAPVSDELFVIESSKLALHVTLGVTEIQDRWQALQAHGLATEPVDLIVACLCGFSEQTKTPLTPLEISIDSDLPPSIGLGSSAALAVALTEALNEWYSADLTPEQLHNLAMQAECFVHERSSGLDVMVSLQRSAILYRDGVLKPLTLPRMPLGEVVLSGARLGSTAECVQAAKAPLAEPGCLAAFSEVTASMANALAAEDCSAVIEAVRENHRLLCVIGVVPMSVQDFVKAVADLGGAAKICGAGAVRGDQAGVLWVVGESLHLAPLLVEFDYTSLGPLLKVGHD